MELVIFVCFHACRLGGGVTKEAVARMAVVAVPNIISVIDGKPIKDNVINKEVLG